jgi:hypothetical protein
MVGVRRNPPGEAISMKITHDDLCDDLIVVGAEYTQAGIADMGPEVLPRLTDGEEIEPLA